MKKNSLLYNKYINRLTMLTEKMKEKQSLFEEIETIDQQIQSLNEDLKFIHFQEKYND